MEALSQDQARAAAGPRDLRDWLSQAETFRPAILDASASACQALAEDANANIPRLTEVVLADPGLALHLLTQVNRSLAGKGRAPAATVNHIALLRGLPAVLAAPADLPTLAVLPARGRSGLLRSFNRALQTAILLREWGRRHPALASEEAFIDGLLHHLVEQFLWQCAPRQAALLETIEPAADGTAQSGQERSILGCSRDELGAGLAGEWHLSRDLRDSFRGDLKAHQTTPLAVRHAATLVRLSEWGWYGKAMEAALEACATVLGFAPERLPAQVHHAAVDAAREAGRHYPGVCPSAWLLPGLPGLPSSLYAQDRRPPPDTQPRSATSGPRIQPGPPAAVDPGTGMHNAPPSREDSAQARLQQCLAELKQGSQDGLEVQDIINLGLRTLVTGAHFERASFCLLNKTRDALHVRFSLVRGKAVTLQGRVFDIRAANLLRALMQKPQSIHIDAGNRARYQPMFPDELRRNALVGEMVLMSIHIKDRPIGLLLAEAGSLKGIQRKVFKHVGQLIIKSIQA